jgi:hypothetical protein
MERQEEDFIKANSINDVCEQSAEENTCLKKQERRKNTLRKFT